MTEMGGGMRRKLLLGLWAGLLGIVSAGGAMADDGDAEILAVTDAWIEAFNARDAERIAALYSPDALFWGTVSKTIRITPEDVVAYFTESTTRRPRLRMQLGERHVRRLGDAAIVSGYYSSVDPREEGDFVTPLRFTFVYAKRAAGWTIVSHHSSRMP
jgi:uncharacterized protein (TIGR02246 family)